MAAPYSDSFSGSGALGTLEVGGLAWNVLSGTWSRSNGKAYSGDAASSNPMAVVDVALPNADVSIDVSSGGGDALYFRVQDVSNWWRLRVNRYQTSSTYYTTQYQWAQDYYQSGIPEGNYGSASDPYTAYQWSDYGGTIGPQAPDFSYLNAQGYVLLNNPYKTGATQQVAHTSTSYVYQAILEKCVAGTVTSVKTYSIAPTNLRITAKDDIISVYINGAQQAGVTDAALKTATKFGIGKGASNYTASSIDNFALTIFVPPAPTITSPSANQVVGTATPDLVGTVNAFGTTPSKLEWQLAQDSAFTTALLDLVELDSAYRVSGSSTTTVPDANKLTQTTWYVRSRQLAQSGEVGNWTTAFAITVKHVPGVVNMRPTGGNGIAYASTVRLTYDFQDSSPTDSQSAHQIEVQRNDNAQVLADTGKVAIADEFYDLALTADLKDVQLRWRATVWDQEDVPSVTTPWQVFQPSDPPTVAITEPATEINSSRPTIQWTTTVSGGRSQQTFDVGIKINGAASGFDSGVIAGTDTSYQPDHAVADAGNDYDVTVTITDTIGLTGTATVTVPATYEQPAIVPFDVDTSTYATNGYIWLTWIVPIDDQFQYWKVYRRPHNSADWTVLAEITEASVTEYKDWMVPAQQRFDYMVSQVVLRYGKEVESVVQSIVTVTTPPGDYWLIDPIDSNNNVHLYSVKDDGYSPKREQAEVTIVGRGRHVDVGEVIGVDGSLTAQLRDSFGGTTARFKKQALEALYAKKSPVYLRNPFGDITYIALGDISISRIAGVGGAEFCDVTIPYQEVGE